MIDSGIEKVLINFSQIQSCCEKMAKTIESYSVDTKEVPLLVGLLKGSVPFMAELIKHITIPVEIDFLSAHSYEGIQSSGKVKIDKDLDISCLNRTVWIIEDIIDTGRTLLEVKQMLLERGAQDVVIVTLLDKPEGRKVQIEADHVGFTIPNAFVVGFGLDYNEKYRNLPYIGVLKPEVYL